jgi:uncharacterized protein
MPAVFLTAEWRKLAIANYVVDPKILLPYLPHKTELDLWNGICYASLIGFKFANVKLKGIKIPFHTNFEEVNIRFYVKYKEGNIWKRGVVFVKEIVPKLAISLVANTLYKENYQTLPMRHTWEQNEHSLKVTYEWKKQQWNSFSITTDTILKPILPNSEEEFITEHYWGYSKMGPTKTNEYGVEHPRWEVYTTKDYTINVDFENVYGYQFAFLNHQTPESVFLAEGSEILVRGGKRI